MRAKAILQERRLKRKNPDSSLSGNLYHTLTAVKEIEEAEAAILRFIQNQKFSKEIQVLLQDRKPAKDLIKILQFVIRLRVRFFKKIQDWILKSVRIWKRILRFFTKQINPRSPGSWCLKGTEESTLEVDSSVPLTRHDPRDLGLICLVKKRKIRFQILADFKIQSWIFLKKRTLR